MRVQPLLLALALLAASMAGCLGSEARSEWAFDVTQLDEVYDQGKRGTGVRVAVIDTGINVDHPSLAHLVDGDNDNGELIGFKDYVGGNDGVANAYDDAGHGTHVVGIMSARGSSFGDKLTNGGVDLLGASPGIQLLVAKVCDGDENCQAGDIPEAVDWARRQGAQIISISLGGDDPFRDSPLGLRLQDEVGAAINTAIDNGIIVIASAGNDGPSAEDVAFPSSIEGVISVGALNEDRRVASFSQPGNSDDNTCTSNILSSSGRCDPHKKPEILAPGTEILSAWTGSNYVRASGTSQATPFVTSAVALMLEGKAKLSDRDDVEHIKNILRNSASPIQGQEVPHDDAAGYGILQAKDAVRAYGG